jgi:hypothetical protein
MLIRRDMLISTMPGLGVAALGIPWVSANEWRNEFAALNFGVVSSKDEADRIARYKAFVPTWSAVCKCPSKSTRPEWHYWPGHEDLKFTARKTASIVRLNEIIVLNFPWPDQ